MMRIVLGLQTIRIEGISFLIDMAEIFKEKKITSLENEILCDRIAKIL